MREPRHYVPGLVVLRHRAEDLARLDLVPGQETIERWGDDEKRDVGHNLEVYG
jgi:hypothetical protein